MANLEGIRRALGRYFTEPIVTVLQKTHITPNARYLSRSADNNRRGRADSARTPVCCRFCGFICRTI